MKERFLQITKSVVQYLKTETLPAHIYKAMENKTNKTESHLSRRDFIKAAGVVAGSLTLAACNTESTVNEKVTNSSLILVSDPKERNEIFESLGTDIPKPKNKDKVNVFKMTVGSEIVKCVMYEMSEEAVEKDFSIRYVDKNGNVIDTKQNIAMFTEMITGPDTSKWQRLVGLSIPTKLDSNNQIVESSITWYYQPTGYPTQEKQMVQLGFPVLGYDSPNANNIQFEPLISDNYNIEGYEGGILNVNKPSNVPDAFKVNALLIPVNQEITKELPEEIKKIEKDLESTNYVLSWDEKQANILVKYKNPDGSLTEISSLIISPEGKAKLVYGISENDKLSQHLGKTFDIDIKSITVIDDKIIFKETDNGSRMKWFFDPINNRLCPEITSDYKDGDMFNKIDFNELMSPEFDERYLEYVLNNEATMFNGKEIPFKGEDLLVDFSNSNQMLRKYGWSSNFSITPEAKAIHSTKDSMPVKIVTVLKTEPVPGLKLLALIEAWKTDDGSIKLRKVICPDQTTDGKKDALVLDLYSFGYFSTKAIPSGIHITSRGIDDFLDAAIKIGHKYDKQKFKEWYLNNIDLFVDTETYEDWKKTGIFSNNPIPITIGGGKAI